jgi:hypothetical protein
VPPVDPKTSLGTPPYVYDQGWVSILTADGFVDEQRVTRSNILWLPKLMQLGVVLGYNVIAPCEFSITELYAEP